MTDRPQPGDTLPDIALEGADGAPMRLADFRGRKLAVFFYPKDDTPGCTTENRDFTALADEFAAADTALLGVSKDSAARHARFAAKYALAHPLATDAAENGLSDAIGVWTEKQNYGRTYMGMVRTTYLIDADGKVARVWDKVKVKGHAAEVLAAAQGL
ncbi:peroxiredoxin [Parablastomonas sp. CN1-191]|uniref:peroxiredoxin n=1 Tax=Parablastomonas sp. CN1-191 TaxID=3400908 RepID=UPI003BF8CBE8